LATQLEWLRAMRLVFQVGGWKKLLKKCMNELEGWHMPVVQFNYLFVGYIWIL